ncbi:TlpA family protein disulfide reductase [Prosthecobacter vanneervenii]|uniref:Thiol-disulfide isomerase/thioredoxin n=1 Tax=Prosthecobacter vanneervenii TaxID=48466 RepID=A0A7W7YF41_9BACT|nr:TlpA disulfide reductase family protein [Prosthecobacter vanneervenii]MBB5034710.1 thiol-disulfide isomerase/thioredoxin [Prosthecobacter vanneervenii]
MKAYRLLCLGVTTFVLAISTMLRAAEADAEWKKVADIMESIRNLKEDPQTSDAARLTLKKSLMDFDAAYEAAMKAAPANPERWDVALFAAMLGRLRALAGVTAPAREAISLEEITKAPDAKPETRSQASLTQVMLASDSALAPGGDTAAWIAQAEKHLKNYPAEKLNKMVQDRLAEVSFRTKPLELKFTALDGRVVDVSKLQGKVVLIDFWATWCGPCVEELPKVIKLYQELHEKGFEVVGISLDQDKAELEAFLKEKGMEWPQYFDGKGAENELFVKYKLESIPTAWLLNKKGVVASKTAFEGLEEQVKKLLAE